MHGSVFEKLAAIGEYDIGEARYLGQWQLANDLRV